MCLIKCPVSLYLPLTRYCNKYDRLPYKCSFAFCFFQLMVNTISIRMCAPHNDFFMFIVTLQELLLCNSSDPIVLVKCLVEDYEHGFAYFLRLVTCILMSMDLLTFYVLWHAGDGRSLRILTSSLELWMYEPSTWKCSITFVLIIFWIDILIDCHDLCLIDV